jgi:hypothetical protein
MRKQAGTFTEMEVPNVLAYDMEYYAKEILRRAKDKIGHLYPAGKDKHPVVGYLWARTAPCSNLSCKAEIPLLSSLLICDKKEKKVALTMTVTGKEVSFGIARDKAILSTEGTMLKRGNCRCRVCQQPTPVNDLRQAGLDGKLGERLVAVILDTPGGKGYRPPELQDFQAVEQSKILAGKMERPGGRCPSGTTRTSASVGTASHLGSLLTLASLSACRHWRAAYKKSFANCAINSSGIPARVECCPGMWVAGHPSEGTITLPGSRMLRNSRTVQHATYLSICWDYG